jgi:hypothetical protein
MAQKQGKEVTRGGVRGTMVEVSASERFVPHRYPGTDPRTKAKHRNG